MEEERILDEEKQGELQETAAETSTPIDESSAGSEDFGQQAPDSAAPDAERQSIARDKETEGKVEKPKEFDFVIPLSPELAAALGIERDAANAPEGAPTVSATTSEAKGEIPGEIRIVVEFRGLTAQNAAAPAAELSATSSDPSTEGDSAGKQAVPLNRRPMSHSIR